MALPVNGSTHLVPAYYSFYRRRKDERLSWPSWLTYSGWLTHISGHPSAAGRAQEGKVRRPETDVLPLSHATNLCHATITTQVKLHAHHKTRTGRIKLWYHISQTLVRSILHRESKKTRHLTLAHNFTKYLPIFKILSLLDSVGNL